MPSERDPRRHPLPGDLLRGEKSQRLVGFVDSESVGFTFWRIGSECGSGNECYTSRDRWRRWARNAEVLEQA